MKTNHNKNNYLIQYFKQANHKGKITKIIYSSKDYIRGNRSITKEAYVYTPYGYNENDLNKKYNIIYLMHGWTMTAEHYIFKCEIITIVILIVLPPFHTE